MSLNLINGKTLKTFVRIFYKNFYKKWLFKFLNSTLQMFMYDFVFRRRFRMVNVRSLIPVLGVDSGELTVDSTGSS